jgi:Tetratricopeptide repeat/Peptidase MA superfamily
MTHAGLMVVRCVAATFAIVAGLAVPAASQPTRAEQVAVRALEDGDVEKAATAFAEALVQSPRDPRLHFGAGVAAHLRGRDDEARKLLQRALDLEPRLTHAAALFGELAYEHGDLDVAIQTYERALNYAPSNEVLMARLKTWRGEAAKERRVDGLFSISFEGPAEGRLAAHAANALQTSYWRLGKALGAYPSGSIAVVFYTLQDFRDVTGAPEWVGGVFDTRIRLPVRGALDRPDELDSVLTHELAHAMIAGLAPRGVPAWLHEGLATYLEPSNPRDAVRRLRAARTIVPLENLQNGFGGLTEPQARVAYDESLIAASVLLNRLGPNMSILLEGLGRGQDITAALAQFGLTFADFERDVATFMRSSR